MKKLRFVYKRTSKVIVPMDSPFFMAARARYFRALDKLRVNDSTIFWHDETWCNKNEEKGFVWTDGTTSKGRLREGYGKGEFLIVRRNVPHILCRKETCNLGIIIKLWFPFTICGYIRM